VDAIGEGQRETVVREIEGFGEKTVRIEIAQMKSFAGNAFELTNTEGKSIMVMSACAKGSLRKDRLAALGKYATIVAPDIATIKRHGGESARCCICEVALQLREK
jgi:hypothetical protein